MKPSALPSVCFECEAEQARVAEDVGDGLAVGYCGHRRTLIRSAVAGGRVVHTVLDGAVSLDEAERQITALDRQFGRRLDP